MFSGVPSSYVHGSIIDGIFSGRIDLPNETFYVDKTELYFDDRQPFHSVIYASSDVVHELPARFILISRIVFFSILFFCK